MENREAIELLRSIVAPSTIEESVKLKKYYDALDLAISALEFKERYDQFWKEVKTAGKSGKETEIHHSGRVFRIREVAQ